MDHAIMTDDAPIQQVKASTEELLARCKRLNWITTVVHLVQAILSLILCIARVDFQQTVFVEKFIKVPGVQRGFLTYEPYKAWYVAYLIPAFFFTCFLDHLYVSLRYDCYRDNLLRFKNPARWLEYSFSASLMMVCIGLLSGIATYASMLMLFVLTFSMSWYGWAFEEINSPGLLRAAAGGPEHHTAWTAYFIGWVPGAAIWVAVGIPFFASVSIIPNFVIGIYFSIFISYNAFPIIMAWQFSAPHSIDKYIKGEVAFIFASLFAKSILAWQVIGGTFRGNN